MCQKKREAKVFVCFGFGYVMAVMIKPGLVLWCIKGLVGLEPSRPNFQSSICRWHFGHKIQDSCAISQFQNITLQKLPENLLTSVPFLNIRTKTYSTSKWWTDHIKQKSDTTQTEMDCLIWTYLPKQGRFSPFSVRE